MSSKRLSRREVAARLNLAMRQASGLGVLYSQEVAARLGIASTDLECLDHLVTRGPVAAGALAEITGLTTGAITGVIDRLERAGFARRAPDPDDRRKVLVQATDAVGTGIEPYFAPIERASMAALSSYKERELLLILEFLTRAGEAVRSALVELQKMPVAEQRTNTRRKKA